jgi:DNA-3-methyladenine glycosylase
MVNSKLGLDFFQRPDVARIGRELIGKMLCTRIGGTTVTAGMVVETEAYGGVDDRASHAFGGRRTPRTTVMYRAGGVAYVYLCYGLHCLFNIITNREEIPHAVLIRALEPCHRVEVMLRRRGAVRVDRTLAGGPGALCRALGINLRHNGINLTGDVIWLEDGVTVPPSQVCRTPRIGVAYAGEDAARPWRFTLRGSPWLSRPAPRE